MTLESTVSRETFVGNGTTKTFSFTFRVWDTTQILVYRQVTNYSEDDCTSECSIELNDGVAGGTVTFGTAPASGVVIAVVRNMPFVQEDVYNNGVKFDAKEIEDRFDQDCAERQQLLLGVTQAVKVPNTDSRSVEEYTSDFWEAVDDTLANQKKACACAEEACECADFAERQANRAESAGILGTQAENIDSTWDLDADISAGTKITLPYWYYPKRNILRLSYDGVEMYLGSQFEEVGDDDETLSNEVVVLIDLVAGMQMHMWVVMSNVARYADEAIERMEAAVQLVEDTATSGVDRMQSALEAYLDEAETCRDEACACASNAKTSQEIAENSSVEATEQADRADDAAVDAAAAAADAKKAAQFAHLNRQGRCLGAVIGEDALDHVPSGFWVVNPDIVVPATRQHPLTPVPTIDAIPTICDGFYVLAPAFERDYPCTGNGGDGDTDTTSPTASSRSAMMPCGKRSRFEAAS